MLIKSSTETVRQQNSALVLSALRRFGPQSHTDLSVRTGLASATVSAITAELELSRIIERSELLQQGARGRPRVLFAQRADYGYLIVARISSDVVEYSMVDYGGKLIDRIEEARSRSETRASEFALDFLDGLDRLVARSQLARTQVLCISISSKGLTDAQRPRLNWSPIFGSEQIDFGALLAPAWDAEVMLNNETLLVAHALATAMSQARRGSDRGLIVVSLGHSIGLGIATLDPLGAVQASAPNFGHMLHEAKAGRCRCGSNGCIEAAAGFYGILRTAFEVPANTIPAKFVPLGEMDKIATGARHGHKMAAYAFRNAGLALGSGLSRVLNLYEQLPIFITGPGMRYFDLMKDGMDEALSQSLQARLQGVPQITIDPNEALLVFAGHLERALGAIDQTVLA